MDSTQRNEFEAQLGALFGAWGRNLTAAASEGYWKGLAKMSLGDFARCVDRATQQLAEDPDARLPNVGTLWSLKRSLRAQGSRVEQPQDPWRGDKWDIAANLHLLSHIRKHAKRYSDGDPVSAYTRTHTAAVVRAKNTWAQVMREEGEEVDGEIQRAVWDDQMALAERKIDALSDKQAAA